MSDGSDLSFLLEPVARRLLGDPGPLSTDDILRFGPTGALWIDLATHKWGDYNDDQAGGGVLELVDYRTDKANGEAIVWLEQHGFSLEKSEIVYNQKGGDANQNALAQRRDKSLPRELINLELEQQLLGALLTRPGEIPGVSFRLKPEHFSEPLHRRLYDIVSELARAGKHVSAITIQPYMPKVEKSFDLKGYLVSLMDLAVLADIAATSAETLADSIIELALARQLVEVGEDIASAAKSPDPADPAKAQIETAIGRLSAMASEGLRPMLRASSVGSAAQAFVEELDAPTPKERPVSTGLTALDKLIGGYRRGVLYILAGRPGTGKSLLAGSLSLGAARRSESVIFFSMEMTKAQLTARLLTEQAFRHTNPAVYSGLLDNNLSDEHRGLIKQAAREIEPYPLVIDPQPALTIAEIAVRAARYVETFLRRGLRTPLVVIDHLGKIRRPFKQNDNVELGQVTARAAEIAKELGTCFLMLCQLNRSVEQAEDKRPRLSSLRESGHLEEDADVVLMLYREAYYLGKQAPKEDTDEELERLTRLGRLAHDMEILVTKNRHGPEGVARVWCHMGAAIVRDREERY